MAPTLPGRTVVRLEELAVPSNQSVESLTVMIDVGLTNSPIPTGAWYHPVLHPDGVINMSTAENTLLTEEVIPVSSLHSQIIER
jgi:hypothetical protein